MRGKGKDGGGKGKTYLRVVAIRFEVALADFLAVVGFLFVYPASEEDLRV